MPSYTFSNISIIYFSLVRKTKRDTVDLPTVVGWSGADNLPYEKVGKNEPVCIADEVPFDIPESWEWARLKDITIKEIKRGKSPKYADDSNVYVFAQKCNVKLGGIDISLAKFLDMKTFGKYPIEEYMTDGDIIINSTGNGTLGRIGIFRDSDRINDFVIVPDSHVTIIRTGNQMIKDYLFFALKYHQPYLEKLGEGSTNQTELRPSTAAELFVPVPPIGEQERIVAKLLEVLPRADVYGIKEKALQDYNKDFPIQLKKSILQEAVRGKLVPQDPTDEPASILLERIRTEKEQLIKAGKIKRDKHETFIFRRDNSHYEKLDGIERCIDDEIPFEIPDSWVWTRLGQVISLLSGTDFKPEEYNDVHKGIPYITGASSLSENGVFLNRWTETPKVIANFGDVLLVCKGSGYGKTVICDIEEAHIARQIMAIKKFITLDMHYLRLFLQANLDQIKSKGQGVIPGIDRNSVMNLLFPVPPLFEQHRIVEKQRELFTKITLM